MGTVTATFTKDTYAIEETMICDFSWSGAYSCTGFYAYMKIIYPDGGTVVDYYETVSSNGGYPLTYTLDDNSPSGVYTAFIEIWDLANCNHLLTTTDTCTYTAPDEPNCSLIWSPETPIQGGSLTATFTWVNAVQNPPGVPSVCLYLYNPSGGQCTTFWCTLTEGAGSHSLTCPNIVLGTYHAYAVIRGGSPTGDHYFNFYITVLPSGGGGDCVFSAPSYDVGDTVSCHFTWAGADSVACTIYLPGGSQPCATWSNTSPPSSGSHDLSCDNAIEGTYTGEIQWYASGSWHTHTCTVLVSQPVGYCVTPTVVGNGVIVVEPLLCKCPTTCSIGYPVILIAVPGTDSHFSGWSGDVPAGHETDNPLSLILDSNKNITATFLENPIDATTYYTTGPATAESPYIIISPLTMRNIRTHKVYLYWKTYWRPTETDAWQTCQGAYCSGQSDRRLDPDETYTIANITAQAPAYNINPSHTWYLGLVVWDGDESEPTSPSLIWKVGENNTLILGTIGILGLAGLLWWASKKYH